MSEAETPDPLDIDALEKIALGATQEEWIDNTREGDDQCATIGTEKLEKPGSDFADHPEPFCDIVGGCECCGSPWMKPENRAHVVAFQPKVVLALIARIRKLES